MNEASTQSDMPNVGDPSLVKLRYFAVLFAAVLWGFVFGLALLSVYFTFRLNWISSLLALLVAAFVTIVVIVARTKRVLTAREVLRLTSLCFLAHWVQDV